MLHAPITDRTSPIDTRLPPSFGMLIATAGSIALWAALYAVCILLF